VGRRKKKRIYASNDCKWNREKGRGRGRRPCNRIWDYRKLGSWGSGLGGGNLLGPSVHQSEKGNMRLGCGQIMPDYKEERVESSGG